MRSLHVLLALVVLGTVTCEDPGHPASGDLRIEVVTAGGDPDLDGYRLQVDTTLQQTLATNDTIVIPNLATGIHAVLLDGVAANCAVDNGGLQLLLVTGGDTAEAAYTVDCVATGVQIAISTVGLDTATHYTLIVDGAPTITVPVNGSVAVTRLTAGDIPILLAGVPGNCTLATVNPLTVNVVAGVVAPVSIDVTCVAVTGIVEAAVATTGLDLDSDGYTVQLDGGAPQPVGVAGTVRFDGVSVGSHVVTFAGAAANCAAGGGPNPRSVTVMTGTTTRDTVRAAFPVTCTAVTGVVEVTTTTSGLDLDADGYEVRLDGGTPQPAGLNGVTRFAIVPIGDHSISFAGAAANCAAGGGANPRTVTVTTSTTTRDTARTAFPVTCAAVTGVVEVTTATSGLDLDADGFALQLDGGTPQPAGLNGVTWFASVPAGDHEIILGGTAANCSAGANTDTVTVTTGGLVRDTARLSFSVTCGAVTGVIAVTTATGGVDLDQNGYMVTVDSGTPLSAAANGTIYFSGVGGGSHDVRLGDVSFNCVVGGANPRALTITVGGVTRDTARTIFDVACEAAAGSARIITTTTGADIDPDGYDLGVDCYDYGGYEYCTRQEPLGINDTTLLVGLQSGDHVFDLRFIAPNCDVSGANPRTVRVAGAATTDIVFPVTCAALGSLQITATTTGVDLDGNGYDAAAAGPRQASGVHVPTNGAELISGLAPGVYSVLLGDAALNCDVTSANPIDVTVPTGGVGTAAFSLACVTATELAFAKDSLGNRDIYTMRTNGAGLTRLTAAAAGDEAPAWSPDRSKLAFVSFGAGNADIYAMDPTGAGVVQLTTSGADDYHPTWSSSSAQIAFHTDRDGNYEVYVMDADGTNPLRLTNDPATDFRPAWSPDGSKIAFVRGACDYFGCRGDIYTMNPDGSGIQQITSGGQDTDPAWAPNNARLAFSRVMVCDYYYCKRDIFLVNANGSGVAQLTSDAADHLDPAWSPDDSRIVFMASPCTYTGCNDWSLKAVRPDGTDPRAVPVSPNVFNPAWRP